LSPRARLSSVIDWVKVPGVTAESPQTSENSSSWVTSEGARATRWLSTLKVFALSSIGWSDRQSRWSLGSRRNGGKSNTRCPPPSTYLQRQTVPLSAVPSSGVRTNFPSAGRVRSLKLLDGQFTAREGVFARFPRDLHLLPRHRLRLGRPVAARSRKTKPGPQRLRQDVSIAALISELLEPDFTTRRATVGKLAP
jgi:hypothetical protein